MKPHTACGSCKAAAGAVLVPADGSTAFNPACDRVRTLRRNLFRSTYTHPHQPPYSKAHNQPPYSKTHDQKAYNSAAHHSKTHSQAIHSKAFSTPHDCKTNHFNTNCCALCPAIFNTNRHANSWHPDTHSYR
ncbi:hypothetical protein JKP88DRAFT_254389 [Tribonema minus]|uniref:Uncharacterized protein n=1 Tax=Tribonema minus TaxID=303371 RepID=A0A836CIG7_9STRA|nr:hypothetical protein JKP88DRAFT_254389 [Tribonema minus]